MKGQKYASKEKEKADKLRKAASKARLKKLKEKHSKGAISDKELELFKNRGK
jgi:hypothetical protein